MAGNRYVTWTVSGSGLITPQRCSILASRSRLWLNRKCLENFRALQWWRGPRRWMGLKVHKAIFMAAAVTWQPQRMMGNFDAWNRLPNYETACVCVCLSRWEHSCKCLSALACRLHFIYDALSSVNFSVEREHIWPKRNIPAPVHRLVFTSCFHEQFVCKHRAGAEKPTETLSLCKIDV